MLNSQGSPVKKKGRMFCKGPVLTSLDDLSRCTLSGQWIYWNDKPLHPGWIISMQFRTIRDALDMGILSLAIREGPYG